MHTTGRKRKPERPFAYEWQREFTRQYKRKLFQEGRVAFFQFLCRRRESRKGSLGYAVAILEPKTNRAEKVWLYDSMERFWAIQAAATLLDAQDRQILDQRNLWKLYDSVSWRPAASRIESLMGSAVLPLPDQRFATRPSQQVSTHGFAPTIPIPSDSDHETPQILTPGLTPV